MVVVPAVALDTDGNPIGFGGGYYDRFLKQVNCTRIARAYDFQILDSITSTKNDLGVDPVIIGTRVIRCK